MSCRHFDLRRNLVLLLWAAVFSGCGIGGLDRFRSTSDSSSKKSIGLTGPRTCAGTYAFDSGWSAGTLTINENGKDGYLELGSRVGQIALPGGQDICSWPNPASAFGEVMFTHYWEGRQSDYSGTIEPMDDSADSKFLLKGRAYGHNWRATPKDYEPYYKSTAKHCKGEYNLFVDETTPLKVTIDGRDDALTGTIETTYHGTRTGTGSCLWNKEKTRAKFVFDNIEGTIHATSRPREQTFDGYNVCQDDFCQEDAIRGTRLDWYSKAQAFDLKNMPAPKEPLIFDTSSSAYSEPRPDLCANGDNNGYQGSATRHCISYIEWLRGGGGGDGVITLLNSAQFNIGVPRPGYYRVHYYGVQASGPKTAELNFSNSFVGGAYQYGRFLYSREQPYGGVSPGWVLVHDKLAALSQIGIAVQWSEGAINAVKLEWIGDFQDFTDIDVVDPDLSTPPDPPKTGAVRVVDDTVSKQDANFSSTGQWTSYSDRAAYGDDVQYSHSDSGVATARWYYLAGQLTSRYRISTTWLAHPNRATDATFRIYDGANLVGEVRIDQEKAPDTFSDQEVYWTDLGRYEFVTRDISVELSNQANEYVIADAVRFEHLPEGTPQYDLPIDNIDAQIPPQQDPPKTDPQQPGPGPIADIQYLDDGDDGFSRSGSWQVWADGQGLNGDYLFAAKGDGSIESSWTFAVNPGVFRVYTTWVAHDNRAKDAPYRVYSTNASLGDAILVNQEVAPNDLVDKGIAWHRIGTFTIASEALVVRLINDANEYVIADAVRIERIGDVAIEPTPPPVQKNDVQIVDDLDPDFSSTGSDWYDGYADSNAYGGTISFSARGDGSDVASWSFSVNPGVMRISTRWLAHPNRATDAPYSLKVDGVRIGEPIRVQQEDAPNDWSDDTGYWHDLGYFDIQGSNLEIVLTDDADEYVIADAVRVERVGEPGSEIPTPKVQVVDNGGHNFSATSGWTHYTTPQGKDEDFRNDTHFVAAGDGSDKATFRFDVSEGRYLIAATWWPHSNRATDTPYHIIHNGVSLTTVTVNQELAPGDFQSEGANWSSLSTVLVLGGSLEVTISNSADEYVIADAIRVERLD